MSKSNAEKMAEAFDCALRKRGIDSDAPLPERMAQIRESITTPNTRGDLSAILKATRENERQPKRATLESIRAHKPASLVKLQSMKRPGLERLRSPKP
jgi:hypothetical protein